MALPAHRATATTPDQSTDDELIAGWIDADPVDGTPDEALIADRAVSVTAVITQLRLEDGDRAAVAAAYELPAEAVDAALAYHARHREVIDAAITLNAAAFTVDASISDIGKEDELIARWIDPDPIHRTPDKVRIADHTVSVTALITRVRGVEAIDDIAQAYQLPPEAVHAAVAFYRRHKGVIDARMALNAQQFAD